MKKEKDTSKNIDDYVAGFPEEIQEILNRVRATISSAAPGALQTIKYGIPTFVMKSNLVHFGGFKNHIGFYPTPSGIEKFKEELSIYESAKGSIKFPFDKPIPYDLIKRIVQFRVNEEQKKLNTKRKNKK